MKCTGNFIFKCLEKRESGTFTNEQGKSVNYNSSYCIKVDQIEEGKINERKFKFSCNNKELADKFYKLQPYNSIKITFEVSLYASNCRVLPIDVELVQNSNK